MESNAEKQRQSGCKTNDFARAAFLLSECKKNLPNSWKRGDGKPWSLMLKSNDSPVAIFNHDINICQNFIDWSVKNEKGCFVCLVFNGFGCA